MIDCFWLLENKKQTRKEIVPQFSQPTFQKLFRKEEKKKPKCLWAETKMFDIFVVCLYLLLPQFGHVVIAKQRAVCCPSRSPILSSHNNGAALFFVGVKQLHPSNLSRLFKMCSLCSLFLQSYAERRSDVWHLSWLLCLKVTHLWKLSLWRGATVP